MLIGIGVPAALRHHARIDAEASSLNAIIGDDRLTGEVELAHPIFGDDPASVSSAKTVPMSRFSRPMVTRGVHELAYTTTLRFTDQLRMILREIGSRRVAADQIEVVDDVFFMIFDELFTAPTDIRLRIKRRRTERELQLPDMIDHI